MKRISRNGTLVDPVNRISRSQLRSIHQASLSILDDPGLTCFNQRAAELLSRAGCSVSSNGEGTDAWQIRFPVTLVEQALENAPREVVLGARNPENTLVLNADHPRVYFGTGSETNIYLETEMNRSHLVHTPKRGLIRHLCESAKLCNNLDHVDFFIRNVNIQDDGITPDNKDVNVFLASLMHMTKHVQSGLTQLNHLDDVVSLAELVAGGPEQFKKNPVISFITCLIKSPLQLVEDTTEKLMSIARRGLPVVISSSPQGGSTAPIQEEGIVALINAEILAGITLAQTVKPGTPVLYGAVPVRARLDTLHDLYGAPEFIHYNMSCVQMAKHYRIPCYSTAGVGDAKVPGLQATIEKVFSQLMVASAGPQYIHYAFGLLNKTNIFSPLQAVLDNAHIGIVRQILRRPAFGQKEMDASVEEIRKVAGSRTKLFARHIRKSIKKGLVSPPYPFESKEDKDEVLVKAFQKLQEILSGPDDILPEELIRKIYADIQGLLPIDHYELKKSYAR